MPGRTSATRARSCSVMAVTLGRGRGGRPGGSACAPVRGVAPPGPCSLVPLGPPCRSTAVAGCHRCRSTPSTQCPEPPSPTAAPPTRPPGPRPPRTLDGHSVHRADRQQLRGLPLPIDTLDPLHRDPLSPATAHPTPPPRPPPGHPRRALGPPCRSTAVVRAGPADRHPRPSRPRPPHRRRAAEVRPRADTATGQIARLDAPQVTLRRATTHTSPVHNSLFGGPQLTLRGATTHTSAGVSRRRPRCGAARRRRTAGAGRGPGRRPGAASRWCRPRRAG